MMPHANILRATSTLVLNRIKWDPVNIFHFWIFGKIIFFWFLLWMTLLWCRSPSSSRAPYLVFLRMVDLLWRLHTKYGLPLLFFSPKIFKYPIWSPENVQSYLDFHLVEALIFHIQIWIKTWKFLFEKGSPPPHFCLNLFKILKFHIPYIIW